MRTASTSRRISYDAKKCSIDLYLMTQQYIEFLVTTVALVQSVSQSVSHSSSLPISLSHTLSFFLETRRIMSVTVNRANEDIVALKALVTETLQRKGLLPKLKVGMEGRNGSGSHLVGRTPSERLCSVAGEATCRRNGKLSIDAAEGNPGRYLSVRCTSSSGIGRLALDIIAEFLEYFEFHQCMPIYTAESGLVRGDCLGGEEMIFSR